MSENLKREIFDSHPFLKRIRKVHQAILWSGVTCVQVGPGGFLAREGQEANSFYLIHSGTVSIEVHHPDRGMQSIQTLTAGEVVGWSWILEPHRWQFDARAVDEVEGVAFKADWLRQQCEADHSLGYAVLKELTRVIASRLAATRVQHLDIFA